MPIAAELQNLNPSAKLEFYVVDATALGAAEVWRFHNNANALGQQVVWQGVAYQHLPIQCTGFELKADGPRPRPQLLIGDVFGVLAAEVRALQDLGGARLVRKRTHARYLDAVNFPGGVNPEADPTAEYPDELWLFDRITGRDGTQIAWELVSPLDLEGVMLPARQVRNAICGSRYRSSECGYTGPAVAKVDDTPTTDLAQDQCSLRVSGCRLRFGTTAELPIDFFPGAGLVRQM
jgi:lambda family phage minor tail protein L